MRPLCAAGWLASLSALTAVPAAAQPAVQAAPGQLAPGAGALVVDQNRLSNRTPPPNAGSDAPSQPLAAPESTAQAAPATALRQVRIEGRLAGQADAIAAPLIGRPLDAAGIRAVADAFSAAYARTGLALYTVVVPAQDLSSGVLTLRAVEGYIESVSVSGPGASDQNRLIRAYGARLTREKPLTKATLERYLSLMRDVPGVTIDTQLFNSQAPGAVRLAVRVSQKKWTREVAFNTRGTPRLGGAQVQASVVANSLARQGDQARVTVSAPVDVQRFQFGALSYSTVLNAEGLTAMANISYLRTRPKNPPIAGEAFSAGLQLSYPLKRGYTSSLYVTGGLDLLNSDNALYGVDITSDRNRTARAGLSYVQSEPRRGMSVLLTAAAGLEGLGARVDTRLSDADFRKLTLQAAVNQALSNRVVLRLRVLTQFSKGRLPATEQVPLGGEPFGRAFSSSVATGDRGYAGSAELGWTPAAFTGRLKGSELYGFADAGRVWTRARLPFFAATRRDLASVGAGVRFPLGKSLVIGLEGAKAVDQPYPGSGKPWRAIFSWRAVR